ncbi:SagB/ThcOx family dehydrogenase [Alkalitalea saponilacus]|uniref:SagB-type dehydrogenase domain-containing protein n=1 Tax=Alkalitalea saponilacus TaxID=889453 RepID=A0A1T5B9J5_9BACT|nr:SagB/ThcOx family dehydrogenase [Alkalitalea saponilacus]ASB49740.1 nitroreductase [Alkalitalea saponilacus]SKB43938.1 SagB-type dehydrogenase domain-containing protein [Alkalitalea saponilacus]
MQRIILPLLFISVLNAACAQDIQLPSPDKTGGIPLMQALNDRQTTRDFADKDLTLQDLSDICWAAWGFNREDKRTAPSSMNKQEMLLYVFLKKGVYLYNAEEHKLELIKKGDHRSVAGLQDFVADAAVNLIFVADMKKAGLDSPDEITPESLIPSHANSGFMAQNVYLVAASKGLGSVIRAWIDADEVHAFLELDEMKRPLYGQSVGHIK